MNEIERQVSEVLHNLNWLMEPHDSFVELIKVKGHTVILRCVGHCAGCETDCVRTAFKERMPDIELIIQEGETYS
ncbi:MAG: NifU family protein [Nitrospirae bacterium]|nr:NifU family protein [Nitrospirota bacterium]